MYTVYVFCFSSSNCRWNLLYEFGAIEINVILGDIEDGTSCDYDKYQIYDGRFYITVIINNVFKKYHVHN